MTVAPAIGGFIFRMAASRSDSAIGVCRWNGMGALDIEGESGIPPDIHHTLDARMTTLGRILAALIEGQHHPSAQHTDLRTSACCGRL